MAKDLKKSAKKMLLRHSKARSPEDVSVQFQMENLKDSIRKDATEKSLEQLKARIAVGKESLREDEMEVKLLKLKTEGKGLDKKESREVFFGEIEQRMTILLVQLVRSGTLKIEDLEDPEKALEEIAQKKDQLTVRYGKNNRKLLPQEQELFEFIKPLKNHANPEVKKEWGVLMSEVKQNVKAMGMAADIVEADVEGKKAEAPKDASEEEKGVFDTLQKTWESAHPIAKAAALVGGAILAYKAWNWIFSKSTGSSFGTLEKTSMLVAGGAFVVAGMLGFDRSWQLFKGVLSGKFDITKGNFYKGMAALMKGDKKAAKELFGEAYGYIAGKEKETDEERRSTVEIEGEKVEMVPVREALGNYGNKMRIAMLPLKKIYRKNTDLIKVLTLAGLIKFRGQVTRGLSMTASSLKAFAMLGVTAPTHPMRTMIIISFFLLAKETDENLELPKDPKYLGKYLKAYLLGNLTKINSEIAKKGLGKPLTKTQVEKAATTIDKVSKGEVDLNEIKDKSGKVFHEAVVDGALKLSKTAEEEITEQNSKGFDQFYDDIEYSIHYHDKGTREEFLKTINKVRKTLKKSSEPTIEQIETLKREGEKVGLIFLSDKGYIWWGEANDQGKLSNPDTLQCLCIDPLVDEYEKHDRAKRFVLDNNSLLENAGAAYARTLLSALKGAPEKALEISERVRRGDMDLVKDGGRWFAIDYAKKAIIDIPVGFGMILFGATRGEGKYYTKEFMFTHGEAMTSVFVVSAVSGAARLRFLNAYKISKSQILWETATKSLTLWSDVGSAVTNRTLRPMARAWNRGGSVRESVGEMLPEVLSENRVRFGEGYGQWRNKLRKMKFWEKKSIETIDEIDVLYEVQRKMRQIDDRLLFGKSGVKSRLSKEIKQMLKDADIKFELATDYQTNLKNIKKLIQTRQASLKLMVSAEQIQKTAHSGKRLSGKLLASMGDLARNADTVVELTEFFKSLKLPKDEIEVLIKFLSEEDDISAVASRLEAVGVKMKNNAIEKAKKILEKKALKSSLKGSEKAVEKVVELGSKRSKELAREAFETLVNKGGALDDIQRDLLRRAGFSTKLDDVFREMGIVGDQMDAFTMALKAEKAGEIEKMITPGVRVHDAFRKIRSGGAVDMNVLKKIMNTPGGEQAAGHALKKMGVAEKNAGIVIEAIKVGKKPSVMSSLLEINGVLKSSLFQVKQTAESIEAAKKLFEKINLGEDTVKKLAQHLDAKQLKALAKSLKKLPDEALLHLAQHPDDVARLILKQGPDAAATIARLATSAENFADLLKIANTAEAAKGGFKLPARLWQKTINGWNAALASGATDVTKLGEAASKQLKSTSRWMRVGQVAGIAAEVLFAAIMLADAHEIDVMVERMEEFANDERLSVLRERANFKRAMALGNAGVGIWMVFANPSIPVTAIILTLQMGAESLYSSYSLAYERRARSPQEWASERSRENLVSLWVSEEGLSNGDRLRGFNWIYEGKSGDQLRTAGNEKSRARMLRGILLHESGITDPLRGKKLMEELEGPVEKRSELAKVLSYQFEFIKTSLPDLKATTPVMANSILRSAKLYAQMKIEGERLTSTIKDLENLKTGKETSPQIKAQFKIYLLELQMAGKIGNPEMMTPEQTQRWVPQFIKEKYAHATPEKLKSYQNLSPNDTETFQKVLDNRKMTAKEFFKKMPARELKKFGALQEIVPLSGSILDKKTATHAESILIRQGFEARMNELYSLLAYSQQSAQEISHKSELESCFNFCLQYYESVYGIPYQPSQTSQGLDEARIYEWVQSLSQVRGRGVKFDADSADGLRSVQGLGMSDSDIELNYNVTRQKETQGLFALATMLGYRGPLKKTFILQYFTNKRDEIGFYYNGDEWVVADKGVIDWKQTDEGFSDWVQDQLLTAKLIMPSPVGFVRIPLSKPSTQREKQLIEAFEGKYTFNQDNPFTLEYLADYTLKYRYDMIMREDDSILVNDESVSEEARGRIGKSYHEFLVSQQQVLEKQKNPEAQKAFKKKLTSFLAGDEEQFTVLPAQLIREGYLVGNTNMGNYAYRLVGKEIQAYQIAPSSNNNYPEFVGEVIKNSEMNKVQFQESIQSAADSLVSEEKAHKRVLYNIQEEFKGQIDSLGMLNKERKDMLNIAMNNMLRDFKEIDAVVYKDDFEITKNHRIAYAKRMRNIILKLSELLVNLRGEKDGKRFHEIFSLSRVVHKYKQLYLISFLNKSHDSSEDWYSFAWHNPEVNETDDWIKVEKDLDNHLSSVQVGEVYKDQSGVKEFFSREETEITAKLGSVPASRELKEEYKAYFLRETSQLIYMVNVYGLNSKGELNTDVPFFQPEISEENLDHLKKIFQTRRLSFAEWLKEYKGEDGQQVEKIAGFDVESQEKTVTDFLKEQDVGLNKARTIGPAASRQTRSLMVMSLTFKNLVEELNKQYKGKNILSESFPEMDNAMNQFNRSDLLNGGLDSLGYTQAFSADARKMEGKSAMENYAYRVDKFYKLNNPIMREGLKDIWAYMKIPLEHRVELHKHLGDQEEKDGPINVNGFSIRRVTALYEHIKHGSLQVSAKEHVSFRIQYLAQDRKIQELDKHLRADIDKTSSYYRASPDHRMVFQVMRKELKNYEDLLPLMKKGGVPKDQIQKFESLYKDARDQLGSLIKKIWKYERTRNMDDMVSARAELKVLRAVSECEKYYKNMPANQNVFRYWRNRD